MKYVFSSREPSCVSYLVVNLAQARIPFGKYFHKIDLCPSGIFLIDDWCGIVQLIVGGASPGLVILGV